MLNNSSKTIWIINQYASTLETGMGGRHYYLAKELAKQGHKVYLIASSYTHLLRKLPEIEDDFKIESVDGFSFVWVKMLSYSGSHDKKRVWNWLSFAWKILKLPKVMESEPDTVLYSSPSLIPFISAERLAKKCKAKLIFEVRDIWPLSLTEIGGYSPKNFFIMLMQWIEDKAYRKSDMVLSNLPNAVEHMVSRGMKRDKFRWVPNGIDIDEVSNPEPLSDQMLMSLPKNKFMVGYVGTLGVANALDSFIQAAALTKDDDSLAWIIVGDGKEKSNLQGKSRELGLHNISFIDSVPKSSVQSILIQFDICYIGWKNQPIYRFGIAANKIPEYLYSGRPIVHGFSGFGDPVQAANAGLSIPTEDPQSIVNAVLDLKSMTPEQRACLGQNGRDYALQKYDYARLAQQLSKVLFF